jgi:hypothetical protein
MLTSPSTSTSPPLANTLISIIPTGEPRFLQLGGEGPWQVFNPYTHLSSISVLSVLNLFSSLFQFVLNYFFSPIFSGGTLASNQP